MKTQLLLDISASPNFHKAICVVDIVAHDVSIDFVYEPSRASYSVLLEYDDDQKAIPVARDLIAFGNRLLGHRFAEDGEMLAVNNKITKL